ncbi:flagellar hook-length control protein FliK [Chromobacterium sphagni]|uniref:Flagellar hook-length control protein-like C-terminal domain-containing protein n=1 Tax=Chromobacterium sphagni TaxID=1903179 RepID=A0A1S1WW30_9NEIS|nr:flagellar hook-length control protein FliK [Chromobacterium sphagni]OHX11327.1 hypothetical protein BI347_16730 [Chromobacterium sphagni]OHX18996.1 hypothetical protein BI344_10275 [Chromobacterium sphagni]
MTITVNTPVTNAASAASPGAGGGATGSAGSGAGSDLFASLLGIQMTAIGSMLPGTGDGGDAKPVSDKPAAKDDDAGGDAQAAAAMPLLAAMQASLQQQPQPVDPKTPSQDLLAQQVSSKPDLSAMVQAKPLFNWQSNQQKLPDPDPNAVQFLPLQQLQQQQPANAQSSANMPVLTLPQTLNDPAWGKALGEQMLTMVNMKADKAQIQLNPPQMGPIEITLKMNGTDQAQVLFTAAVPATREALENNMHQLRSMLSSSGIQLTDSQVSSGQSGQQQQAYQQKKGRSEPVVGEVDGVDALSAIKAARGILSIFA